MKRSILFSILVLFFLDLIQCQTIPIKRETRGAWIATVANIDWPSSNTSSVAAQQAQLTSIFDQLSAAGINVAIFQIRSECDAMYQSPYDPWSYWLTGSQGTAPNPLWDPLAYAVQLAHERGMELHAWFNPYRAERSVGNYSTSSNHVTKTHPEWILQVVTSPTTGAKVNFLDPGLQAVRDYVSKIISDVVRRYDVDAAHMDDYFYVEPMGNQDATTFANFPRGFTDLGDWRRDNVNLLIKQVYDSIQVIKPWVKWGISPRGIWRNGVPTGIVGNDNYITIFCDAKAWLNGKYIDYLAPQLYWKIGGNQDYTKLLPWWNSVSNGREIIPGLAAYRINASGFGPASEIANQIRFDRADGSTEAGNFLYTTNSITGNFGGIIDTLKNDLYHYKALLPPMKWKDTIPPNAPQQIRFARLGSNPIDVVQWDTPSPASDGDTAGFYVVYKTPSASVSQTDIDDAKNILSVSNSHYINPLNIATPVTGNFVVTTLDRNHNESPASGVVSITTPPLQPVLASPANNEDSLSASVPLRWNYTPLSSAYKIQISRDSSFVDSLTTTTGLLQDSSYIASNLEGQRSYYWRVKGINFVGEGNYSSFSSFMTGQPETPLLAFPANLSTNLDVNNIVFSWNKTKAASSYRAQLSLSLDFSTPVLDSIGLLDTTMTVFNLNYNKIYNWRVSAKNIFGESVWSSIFRFKTKTATFVYGEETVPSEFALYQNYPNPFNPETKIRFAVVGNDFTILKVYDILGSEVYTLVNEQLPSGTYTVVFNGENLASGVYIYRLISGKYSETKKMVLQK